MKNQKGFAPIIILVVIALAVAGYFAYQNMQLRKSATRDEQTLAPYSPSPAADETANWKTYTTNEKLNINPLFVRQFQDFIPSKLTFKHPSSWVVFVHPSEMDTVYNTHISLGFDLRKDDPRFANCQSQGPCENFANINLRFGLINEKLEDFDGAFWGQLYPIGKQIKTTINSIEVSQAFNTTNSPYPMGTLFHLSPDAQLYVVSEFFNYNDQENQTEYSKTTIKEINQILSTFRFTD